ncbi:MAG: DNA recombination protein RmuC [Alphaproteobacteria bacterium]|nr:DNA recombination protein RmuC [Alphaproteobacteria bacterium]
MTLIESLKPEELLAVVAVMGCAVGALAAWLVMRARLIEVRAQAETMRARLDAELEAERRVGQERVRALEDAEHRLRESFQALSAEALQRNNAVFLDLARAKLGETQEHAKGELDLKQQAIAGLVDPVRAALEKMGGVLGAIEKDRVGAYETLKAELQRLGAASESLRAETGKLAQSLRSPVARGRWGEVQLRRVVELVGMLAHCDFVEQQTGGDERRLRPDMIVRLSGGKTVVVDAKAPLEAYLRAADTQDEDEKRRHLAQHAADVRGHMKRLGEKGYWSQFGDAPEFVVMFLPGEAFFAAALQADPALIEYGAESGVVPATPTTLIALLRAVQYGWKQERLAENAKVISELGTELYRRVGTMAESVASLGKSLDQAVQRYNQAVGSLETRVLPQARKFKELGAAPEGNEIEPLKTIETTARALASPEMTTPPDGTRPN